MCVVVKRKRFELLTPDLAVNFRRSVIIAELWRHEVARPGTFLNNFLLSFMVKFSTFCSESFHRFTDRRCVQMSYNFSDGKSAKSCFIYGQKKIRLPLKLSLLRGSHPKSARDSPQHLAHILPDFIQIGSLLAELKPNAWRPFFAPWSICMIGSSSL